MQSYPKALMRNISMSLLITLVWNALSTSWVHGFCVPLRSAFPPSVRTSSRDKTDAEIGLYRAMDPAHIRESEYRQGIHDQGRCVCPSTGSWVTAQPVGTRGPTERKTGCTLVLIIGMWRGIANHYLTWKWTLEVPLCLSYHLTSPVYNLKNKRWLYYAHIWLQSNVLSYGLCTNLYLLQCRTLQNARLK